MAVDHSKLDALVFGCINSSSLGLTLTALVARLQLLSDTDGTIAAESRAIGKTLERAVDTSLQRLRKKQRIFYFSPVVGWRVKEGA